MSLNAYNGRVIVSLREAIDKFALGELDLEAIQSILQSALGLLENDGSGVSELVRLAEADVEEVRFTRHVEEQRPAAVIRLEALRKSLLD